MAQVCSQMATGSRPAVKISKFSDFTHNSANKSRQDKKERERDARQERTKQGALDARGGGDDRSQVEANELLLAGLLLGLLALNLLL
jgi:hypothetical protein